MTGPLAERIATGIKSVVPSLSINTSEESCLAGRLFTYAYLISFSGSAVSQHLKVLLQAQLVGVEKQKNSRIYYLRKEGFEDLQQYLGQFWDDHLTVLKQLAEAEERG
jgi:DNA-binding transcriptional ArsR family regulator